MKTFAAVAVLGCAASAYRLDGWGRNVYRPQESYVTRSPARTRTGGHRGGLRSGGGQRGTGGARTGRPSGYGGYGGGYGGQQQWRTDAPEIRGGWDWDWEPSHQEVQDGLDMEGADNIA